MTSGPSDGDLVTGEPRTGVDRLLGRARAGLARLTPQEALDAQSAGALVVDTRPHAQRVADGELPGALVIERNLLEWRFDPLSSARVPEASAELRIVVVCSEGYSSSLAAAALQDVGVTHATDLVGGFLAWRDAGLPTVPGGTPTGSRS